MVGIDYFDILLVVVIFLLSLKGVLDGFIKELFSIIGVIGGIFIASSYAETLGGFISSNIISMKNESASVFLAFLVVLTFIWVVSIFLGKLFDGMIKLNARNENLDRTLGFLFGGVKIFLVFATIFYAFYTINSTKKVLERYVKGSKIFPVMIETGAHIIKIKPPMVSKTNENKGA